MTKLETENIDLLRLQLAMVQKTILRLESEKNEIITHLVDLNVRDIVLKY